MNAKAKFPRSSIFILGTEAAERFSYYGMRSILTLYMVTFLMIPEYKAASYYHLFAAWVYFTPLIGAFVADKWLGKYKTIVYFSLVYIAGQLVISFLHNMTGLAIGLALIALGAGGIKPCVSAFLGDQFKPDQASLKTKAFSFFYFSINLGSFFATILTPITKEMFGYEAAFLVPAALMLLALIVFLVGTKSYTINLPKKDHKSDFFPILKHAFKTRKEGEHFFDGAYSKFEKHDVDGVRSVMNVLKIYAIVIVFWSMFDQQGSSWVIQGHKMDLNVLGYQIQPEMMQATNPILVMILIPLTVFVIYPLFKLNPLRRIGWGMFIAGTSFIAVGLIERMIESGMQLSILWQIVPYAIITLAEVFVSVTGLEFAYTQSPESMKSIVTSLWLLTTFLGNLLTSIVAAINVFDGPGFFYFFGILSMSVVIPYYFIARNYKLRNF